MPWAKDVGIAAALVLALAVVGFLDGRPRLREREPRVTPASSSVGSQTPRATRLRLAVTPPHYDDMGRLLEELGEGYSHNRISLENLLEPETLNQYDVVFLTCGPFPLSWGVGGAHGEGGRPGTVRGEIDPRRLEQLRRSLRAFVGAGGTLYVSDWRYQMLAAAFDQLVDSARAEPGAQQRLVAEVVDAGLRDLIGDRLPLDFDMPGWYPAAFQPSHATVYLQGRYTPRDGGRTRSCPLLVKVPFERGAIIYTAFHNEANNTPEEKKLLRYLVFSSVMARVEAKVAQTLLQGGFSPRKVSILDVSGKQALKQTYHNPKRGTLRFVLAFAEQGARLRLDLAGPEGRSASQEGTATFTVEIADAPAGAWTCTITALAIPYPNFPFSLTIGQ